MGLGKTAEDEVREAGGGKDKDDLSHEEGQGEINGQIAAPKSSRRDVRSSEAQNPIGCVII